MQALSIYILIRLDEGETEYNNHDTLLVNTVVVGPLFLFSSSGADRDPNYLTFVGTSHAVQQTRRRRHAQLAIFDVHFYRPKNLERLATRGIRAKVSRTSPLHIIRGLESKVSILIFSVLRLCVVYQVVNLLVYFEPAAMCDVQKTGLLLAPLPAKKQLWEAADERAWEAESQVEAGLLQTAYGLAADGDLVRLHGGQRPRQSKGLDESTPARSTASWEEWCSGMDSFGGLVMLAASLVT